MARRALFWTAAAAAVLSALLVPLACGTTEQQQPRPQKPAPEAVPPHRPAPPHRPPPHRPAPHRPAPRPPKPSGPPTFYVAREGDDGGPGTSPARPWRTVERVNAARLRPGERVLFKGGEAFDGLLTAERSGSSRAPITYGSYGRGRAILTGGVFLRSVAWVVLERLAVRGTPLAVLGSAGGSGTRDVVVRGLAIEDVGIGIESGNTADSDWKIERNRISRTRDSGLIVEGSGFAIAHNTITATGLSSDIPYGKHGIYAKGRGMRITANTIAGFADNGVSVRAPDAVVARNRISGGPIGVAFFQEDDESGRVVVAGNEISEVSRSGVYLDHWSVGEFAIVRNRIRLPQGAIGISVAEVPSLTIAENTVAGSSQAAAIAVDGASGYSEHDNVFVSPAVVQWGGQELSLSAYRAASGQGAGDAVRR